MKLFEMIKMKTRVIIPIFFFGIFLAQHAYGDDLVRTSLHVAQMRCSSCLRVFDAELRKVPGIHGMTARFKEKMVVVDHELNISPKKIAGTISQLGYPATVLSSRGISREEASSFQRAGFGAGGAWCSPGGASPVAESWKELRRRLFRNGRGR